MEITSTAPRALVSGTSNVLGHYPPRYSMYSLTRPTPRIGVNGLQHAPKIYINFALPSSFLRAGKASDFPAGVWALQVADAAETLVVAENQKQGYAYPVAIDAANVIVGSSE